MRPPRKRREQDDCHVASRNAVRHLEIANRVLMEALIFGSPLEGETIDERKAELILLIAEGIYFHGLDPPAEEKAE